MKKYYVAVFSSLMFAASLSAGYAGFNAPATHEVQQTIGRRVLYPSKELTPGDILPVAEREVCVTGYTKTVRNVPNSLKKKVFEAYGIKWEDRGQYEVDHFISLELGGSNDIKNLWPEPYLPLPGARQKDVVETYLHRKVCDGDLTLSQAQDMVRTDWYRVYVEIRGGFHQ